MRLEVVVKWYFRILGLDNVGLYFDQSLIVLEIFIYVLINGFIKDY